MVRNFRRIKRIILISLIILTNNLPVMGEEAIDISKQVGSGSDNAHDTQNLLPGSIKTNNTPADTTIDSSTSKLIKEELPPTRAEKAESYYEQGVAALKNNEEVEAHDLFNQALYQDPKSNKSRLQLVKLAQKIGWNEKIEELLTEGLSIDPENSDFIKSLSLSYQQTGQMKKALSLLLKMPEKNTYDADYVALLALAYLNNQQPDLAINYYQKLLKSNRENPLWYLGLAISLNANGKYHQAIVNFDKAKQLGKFEPEILDYINTQILNIQTYD